jgi:hypothetical protein
LLQAFKYKNKSLKDCFASAHVDKQYVARRITAPEGALKDCFASAHVDKQYVARRIIASEGKKQARKVLLTIWLGARIWQLSG